ncbi:MAG: hypothetical protein ABI231_00800 [Candidatus Tumulicola sp.]
MVRIRRLAAALAAALAVATVGSAGAAARAQTLQRLTVHSFTLAGDTGQPRVDVPFHLVVTLHVRERVTAIDNLELPILAELELLGDERALASGSNGTLYRETIAVVAHHSGDIVIGPARLQAIDARDRRPKQYSSNGLTLHVAGAAAPVLAIGGDFAAGAMRFTFQLALVVFGTLCAVAIVVLLFRRRAGGASPPPPIAAVVPDPVPRLAVARSPRDQLRDALTVLRAEPTRATAVRIRGVVWRMVGASDGETLADVLQRPEAAGAPMRELLRALERGAFTHDADLAPAIDGACDALERYIAA